MRNHSELGFIIIHSMYLLTVMLKEAYWDNLLLCLFGSRIVVLLTSWVEVAICFKKNITYSLKLNQFDKKKAKLSRLKHTFDHSQDRSAMEIYQYKVHAHIQYYTKTPPQTTTSSYYSVVSTPRWQSLNKKTYILMAHLSAQNVMKCFTLAIAKLLTSPVYLFTPQTCVSIPVVSLSEPASYIQSRRWPCSQVWLHRCWPDRRLQWYSHWWGSHFCQRQLDNKTENIWYSEWLHLNAPCFSAHEHTHSKSNRDADISPLDSITLLSPIFRACDTVSCQLRKVLFLDSSLDS